jgi:hypothetical protein
MTDTRKLTSAVVLLMALAAGGTQTAQAQSYSVPYAFPSFSSGAQPMGNPLIAGNKLYGTTDIGEWEKVRMGWARSISSIF